MINTVFPRNVATVRFYFKALFGGVARFRGRRLQRLTHMCIQSFNNKPICMHVKCICAYTYIADNPLPCSEISRAAFFETSWQMDAATFRGQLDFEMR